MGGWGRRGAEIFPMRGVTGEAPVTPGFPSHWRGYVVATGRPIDVADGGCSIPAEGNGRPYAEETVEWTEHGVTARSPRGASAIRCEQGGGTLRGTEAAHIEEV